MTPAVRIGSWMILALSLPLMADTEQDDPEVELERALDDLEAAIQAFAELETEYIVESVAPVLDSLQPLAESLPVVITDAVNAAGIALHLGRLGITVADPSEDGVQIYHVRPRSSAAQSGLQPHDTIVSINGTSIGAILEDPEQVQVLVSNAEKLDEPLILVAVRDGEEMEVELEKKTVPGTLIFGTDRVPSVTFVSPEQRYSWEMTHRASNSKAITVLEIEKEIGYYFGVEFGVLVVDTPDGHDQLKPGDVVLRFDDNSVRSYSHLKKHFTEALSSDSVKIRIKRRGRTMNIDFSPKKWFIGPAYEYK
ncbi:MAG: PDZ domain-containing protein [Gammaproteobacteria bacterium]|nr:PDZ domain-containing protein [Gammaproteobacteria bacterium]